MGKVPVGQTISAAYRFLVLRPGAVFGLGWLPAAFYAAAAWFCVERLGRAMEVATPTSAAFNEFTAVDFLALLLATALLVPTVAVPFTAAALGRKREPVVAHFVYGKREFHLSLALLSFYVFCIAVLVMLAFTAQLLIGVGLPRPGEATSGFAMPVEWSGVPLALWLNGAAALVLAVVALFLSVRFGFYLAPLAAAEERVTLARAWILSKGSFWRLAVVHVAVAVPAALIFAGAIWLVEGDSLVPVLRDAWTGMPAEGMNGLYRLQYEHVAAIAAILSLGMIATTALFSGASAMAYRATVLGEVSASPAAAPAYTPRPVRAEPDFEPAWAAAKAMADASPRWQPAGRTAAVEPPPEEHALASEAAATTLALAEPEHAEHIEAVAEHEHLEPLAEAEPLHEIAHAEAGEAPPVEEPVAHEAVAAAEPATTHAALSDFILLPPDALQAATETPPLDLGAAVALRERAGQFGE